MLAQALMLTMDRMLIPCRADSEQAHKKQLSRSSSVFSVFSALRLWLEVCGKRVSHSLDEMIRRG
jgi:hypothetical protein